MILKLNYMVNSLKENEVMITIIAKLTKYVHDGFQWIIEYKVEDVQSVETLTLSGACHGSLDYDSIYHTADAIKKPEVSAEVGDNVAITLDLRMCPYTLDVNANFTRVVKHENKKSYSQGGEMGHLLRNPYRPCIIS